jgi:hypothetical protein
MSRQILMWGARQLSRGAPNARLRTYARRMAILFAVIGSASGCTTTAVRPSNQTASRYSARQTVSAADLSRDGQNDTVLAALRRVRPEFFNPRGLAPLAVSIDGGPPEDLSILESMRVSMIEDVSLEHGALTIGPRLTTTGAVIVGDVLMVRTRRGPR